MVRSRPAALAVVTAAALTLAAIACSSEPSSPDGAPGGPSPADTSPADTSPADTSPADTSPAGTSTAGTDAPAGPTLRVATLNILHGNPVAVPACADDDQCDAPTRVGIALDGVAAAGCPEVVTFQEVDERIAALLTAGVPAVCDGAYAIRFLPDPEVSLGVDQELVLTAVPVLDEDLLDLVAFPWSAHHLVLDTALGPVDLVTTHLASGANNPSCAELDCPPFCPPDDDANRCGARQIVDLLDRQGGEGLWVVTGDLNAEPGSPTSDVFAAAGFVDPHLEAGLPECTGPPSGTGAEDACTSGRDEADLADPAARGDERIDYVLVRSGPTCRALLVPSGTGGWADEPVEPRGAGGLVWASDHDGVLAEIGCA